MITNRIGLVGSEIGNNKRMFGHVQYRYYQQKLDVIEVVIAADDYANLLDGSDDNGASFIAITS